MPQQVPQSNESEQALLGSMMLYPDTVALTFEEDVQMSDFFSDAHKKIYQAIKALDDDKKPTDPTSVITRLADLQQLNNVGGADYVMHLTDVAISATNSDYLIKTIKEKSLLRKLIETVDDIKQKSFEEQYDALQVLNEAEAKIVEISRNRKTEDFKTSKTVFDEAIQKLNENSQKEGMTGVPTGFEDLDRITNGFQKGDIIIVAARPSVGKTAFGLNMVVNAATKHNKTVALFSLEMPAVSLANRMLAALSTVDSNKIRTGKNLQNEDWAKIDSAKRTLEKSKIYIDDSSAIKVNDIYAKCRKLKSDVGLDMVVIDYLGLITPGSERADSREREVALISRQLKLMARELEVPVVVLSQLSRLNEKEKREPRPSDLRDSGSIEQDADVVMMLHKLKEEHDENGNETNCHLKVIIAKHRNGSIGNIALYFDKVTNTLYTEEYRNINEE